MKRADRAAADRFFAKREAAARPPAPVDGPSPAAAAPGAAGPSAALVNARHVDELTARAAPIDAGRPVPPHRSGGGEVRLQKPAPFERLGRGEYRRADGARMVEVSPGCFVSAAALAVIKAGA